MIFCVDCVFKDLSLGDQSAPEFHDILFRKLRKSLGGELLTYYLFNYFIIK